MADERDAVLRRFFPREDDEAAIGGVRHEDSAASLRCAEATVDVSSHQTAGNGFCDVSSAELLVRRRAARRRRWAGGRLRRR